MGKGSHASTERPGGGLGVYSLEKETQDQRVGYFLPRIWQGLFWSTPAGLCQVFKVIMETVENFCDVEKNPAPGRMKKTDRMIKK